MRGWLGFGKMPVTSLGVANVDLSSLRAPIATVPVMMTMINRIPNPVVEAVEVAEGRGRGSTIAGGRSWLMIKLLPPPPPLTIIVLLPPPCSVPVEVVKSTSWGLAPVSVSILLAKV